jgi:hypothetical protein
VGKLFRQITINIKDYNNVGHKLTLVFEMPKSGCPVVSSTTCDGQKMSLNDPMPHWLPEHIWKSVSIQCLNAIANAVPVSIVPIGQSN